MTSYVKMMVSSALINQPMDDDDLDFDDEDSDICRFCRSGGSPGRPLFHPCKCIGSIRYIHQECLMQWMRHSKKEFCELCKHPIKFQPIYAASMPSWLPVSALFSGIITTFLHAIKLWLHYSLVALCWLAFVPLVSFRTYKCLFSGSIAPFISLPYDPLETILADCFKGSIIVLISFCVILSLVWLRDQIVNGGGPDWLENIQEDPPLEVVDDRTDDSGIEDNDDNVVRQLDWDDDPAQAGQQLARVHPILNQNNDDIIGPNIIDRAAEELTWERMLGMDGSLVFIEYVFWVATLNVVSITLFGLIPYLLGTVVAMAAGVDKDLEVVLVGRGAILLIGYMVVFLLMGYGHTVARFFNWTRVEHVLGIGFIIVKVALLLALEVAIFPTLSGWWIDICSLKLCDSTLADRINYLYTAPGTTTFLHWLVGMVFVFYFASFVLLLRQVMRPGVLWFLKNLNDPDFHPIQEMITYSVMKHVRRFAISCVVFGVSILLIVWAPLTCIGFLLPGVIPYSVEMSTESILGEISLELLLLQVVLPQLLEQSNSRQWFKNSLRVWAIGVARLLGIRSYLLGDVPNQGEESSDGKLVNIGVPGYSNNIEGLGMGAAQTGPNAELFVPFQPYYRPNQFKRRVATLVGVTCISMFLLFVFIFSVPVSLGRWILQLFMPSGQLHELYTFACGLYTLWAATRLSTLLYNWAVQGLSLFFQKMKEWSLIMIKCIYFALTVFGLIPVLFGLLYEMILLLPIRVPLHHTPVHLLWQDWGLGVLFVKILYAGTLTGPDWHFKRVLEQVFQAGVMQMDVWFVTTKLVLPVVVTQLHLLCIPYTLCSSLPFLGFSDDFSHVCHRRIYPGTVVVLLGVILLKLQLKQFKRLYIKIKNEKYLIGTRLVNFDAEAVRSAFTQTET